METIELFSARVCPFAHRSRLALAEKGTSFELVEIDLRNKPSWYKAINPAEAVPALRQGRFLLQESLIINEYINELSNDPPLLPITSQRRAEARLWINYADTHFVALFYRLLKAQSEDKRKMASDALLSVLTTLNEELHRRKAEGPYWFGESVGLTDIAYYPWFERWPVLEHYRGLSIPDALGSLLNWINTMKARDAVKRDEQSAGFYIAEYKDYASGKK